MGRVRVGTCSWTEPTMVKLWYPKGVTSAEARLRYYAERFDTVEVDSTFYALPDPERSRLWAERTPDWFTFHVKAFGLMTRHSVMPAALEPPLDGMGHGLTRYGRVKDPSPELLDAAFDRFIEGVAPLRVAGKLGGVLLQFPNWFSAADELGHEAALEFLDYAAGRLASHKVLVEFRERTWVDERHLPETLEFLAERGLTYVSVDAPQDASCDTIPPLAEATSDWACVRLHGRNAETWNARTPTAADRFDYLYSDAELREWEDRIRSLAERVDTVFVLFNNNKYDYAQRNASRMNEILEDLLIDVPHAPDDRGEQGALF